MFEIRFAVDVERDLRGIKAPDRRRILDTLEEQLSHEPNLETKNRKILVNLTPPFETVPPVWELRIGDYRAFYDVDEEQEVVYVRAVRRKSPHKTTEEIL
ncbi:MAG: type II toxin-antitoxin system RelE family toxin [Actinomycetota bacterium]